MKRVDKAPKLFNIKKLKHFKIMFYDLIFYEVMRMIFRQQN